MKFIKTQSSEKTKSKNPFYIVLAICLAIAGTASYLTPKIIARQMKAEQTEPAPSVTQRINPNDIMETEVNENVEGIPDDRYTEPGSAVPSVNRAESFSLPMNTEIIKSYCGGPDLWSATMRDWRSHTGVDFKGAVGDPVKAINNGIVIKVTDEALWGTVVEIDHGEGMTARYCGLGKGSTVSEGDTVKINEKIGNLGEIAMESADGPHLHLEIYQNDKVTDPLAAMGKSADNLNE